MPSIRLAGLGVVLVAAACGGGGGGSGMGPCTPGAATQLAKNAGDAQAWYFNNPLPVALSVKALDANNCAVPGVVVNWVVASGGGGVSPAQSTTNASGVATTADSLGSTTNQMVSATTGLASPAAFTEHATSAPTAVGATVGDDFFSPRDTVLQVNGTVTWTWTGVQPHTVSFSGGPESGSPAGTPQTSGTYARMFTTPGKFSYFCRVHGNMTGTVTVVH